MYYVLFENTSNVHYAIGTLRIKISFFYADTRVLVCTTFWVSSSEMPSIFFRTRSLTGLEFTNCSRYYPASISSTGIVTASCHAQHFTWLLEVKFMADLPPQRLEVLQKLLGGVKTGHSWEPWSQKSTLVSPKWRDWVLLSSLGQNCKSIHLHPQIPVSQFLLRFIHVNIFFSKI